MTYAQGDGLPRTPQRAHIPAAYTRVYTGEDGHSRFEDVDLAGESRTVDYAELVAIFSASFDVDEVVFRHVVQEASYDEPHNAPRRQFIIAVSGECEIETSRGEIRRFGPGSVLLLEDTEGHGHITRRIGAEDRLTVLVTLQP